MAWKNISLSYLLFLFFFSLYALTMSGQIKYGDEVEKYLVAQSIVDRHEFSISPTAMRNMVGKDGRTYSIYELGQTLVEVPLYALGRLVQTQLALPEFHLMGMLFVGFLNPILTALSCVLLFKLSQSLGHKNRTPLVLALVFGLGTIAYVYSKDYTREPLLGLLILLTVYALIQFQKTFQARWLIAAGIAAGYLIFSKFIQGASIPIFSVFLLYVVFQNQKQIGASPSHTFAALVRALFFLGLPAILLMLLQSLYAQSRFGTIYGGIGGTQGNPLGVILALSSISDPITIARQVFLSLEKSIFVYSPPAVLALLGSFVWFRKSPREAVLCLALVSVAVATVLARPDGHGGDWWGPRYLVQITPLLILPLGALLEVANPLARRIWTGLLIALGIIGLLVNTSRVLVDGRDHLDIMGKGIDLAGAVHFLRHGALDSLALYLSPLGFPLQINPFGIVLALSVLLFGAWIAGRLGRDDENVVHSPWAGIILMAVVLLIQLATFVFWVVAPYDQILVRKGNTNLVTGNLFLADNRQCEALAYYRMALVRNTDYREQAYAKIAQLMPLANGQIVPLNELEEMIYGDSEAVFDNDSEMTITGKGSMRFVAPPGKDKSISYSSGRLRVVPNSAYELSGWVRGAGLNGSGAGVVSLYEDDGNWLNGRTTDVLLVGGTAGWQLIRTKLTTLPTTKRVFINTGLYKTFGTFWVDSLQLVKIDPSMPQPKAAQPPCQ